MMDNLYDKVVIDICFDILSTCAIHGPVSLVDERFLSNLMFKSLWYMFGQTTKLNVKSKLQIILQCF